MVVIPNLPISDDKKVVLDNFLALMRNLKKLDEPTKKFLGRITFSPSFTPMIDCGFFVKKMNQQERNKLHRLRARY